MIKTFCFCITQCNQRQQSPVLLLVQNINPCLPFNTRVTTQLNNQGSKLSSTGGMIASIGQVLNTQPLKAVFKLVCNVICLHGLILRLRDDQSLASVNGLWEVLKMGFFWNGVLTPKGAYHE